MSTLTIRNLDEFVKQKLRERAASRGVSMEQEARDVLTRNVEAASLPDDGRLSVREILAFRERLPRDKNFDQKRFADDLWSFIEDD